MSGLTGPAPHLWQWLADGTALLDATADDMSDHDVRAPSLLPGWSRAHVLSHLARNAEAVARLARWAATGVETRMYPSREARDHDIEQGAVRPVTVIRDDVRTSAAALDEAFAAIRGDAWDADLIGPTGGPLSARDVPALRAREVWIHLVDLNVGIAFADLPGDFVEVVLGEVVKGMSSRDGFPALRLSATDQGTEHRLGDPAAAPTHLGGAAADLLAWLTGRSEGEALTGAERPALPRWV